MSDEDKPAEPEVSSAATPRFKMRLKPCGGCAGRARALNHWIAFTR
jgi:hypothetical protein